MAVAYDLNGFVKKWWNRQGQGAVDDFGRDPTVQHNRLNNIKLVSSRNAEYFTKKISNNHFQDTVTSFSFVLFPLGREN